MRDEEKTKRQLIRELAALREQIARDFAQVFAGAPGSAAAP